MKKFYFLLLFALIATAGYTQKQDTVKISLAKTSQIIFTIQDKEDLEVLKHYNFQQLFEDMIEKLEKKQALLIDTTSSENREIAEDNSEDNETSSRENGETNEDGENESEENNDDDVEYRGDDDDDDNDDFGRNRDDDGDDESDNDNNDHDYWNNHSHRRWSKSWQSFNFDLGTNNYLAKGEFPGDDDAYAVRPWGSWYLGFSSVQRSRIGKKFFLEWGLGMSWYSFKFQNDNTLIQNTDNGIEFSEDPRDVNFKKSKLSVSYIQASLIPVIDFDDNGRKSRFWDGYNDSFRIGVGPYVGYRISSHSKLVYNDDGRARDKDRDSFNLNNFRYGMRLQLGFRSTDLFFNYDMNELFASGKGPALNAFSFGVIF